MSEAKVLVLNKGYQPVGIVGVERAFGLLVGGIAHALDSEYQTFDFDSWAALSADRGDDVINTVRYALKVPRILVLQAYSKLPRRHIRFSRQNIYLRDKFTCQYCAKQFSRSELNLDHVVPRCQGGKTRWENVVCSCVSCNLQKGGRTPEQAKMKLLRTPSKPSHKDGVSMQIRSAPYKDWLPFLSPTDAAYWNTELLSGEDD